MGSSEQDAAPLVAEDCGLGRFALGEGIIWHSGRVYWVDIPGRSVFSWDGAEGAVRSLRMDGPVTLVLPLDNGELAVSCGTEIRRVSADLSEQREWFAVEPPDGGRRCNDGWVDPAGRVWVGVMATDGAAGAGALYRCEPGRSPVTMLDGLGIPNGLAWSGEGRTLFFADSADRAVRAYPFDPADGSLEAPRTVVEAPEPMGLPDGFSLDADDRLWIGHWGDAKVRCWNPSTGGVEAEISTGARQNTSCAFGGRDFGTLFITSARDGLPEDAPDADRQGALFRCRPGAFGRPTPVARHA